MNPIIGLIELPTNVIASPILLMPKASKLFAITSPSVTKKFYFVDIPFSCSLKKSSSTVSFDGKIHSGAAVITEKSIAKFPN